MSGLRAAKQSSHIIHVRELLPADVVSDESEGKPKMQLKPPVAANKLTLCERTATAAAGRNHPELETIRNQNRSYEACSLLKNLSPIFDGRNCHTYERPNIQSPATRHTGSMDCNHDAHAGFAATRSCVKTHSSGETFTRAGGHYQAGSIRLGGKLFCPPPCGAWRAKEMNFMGRLPGVASPICGGARQPPANFFYPFRVSQFALA